MSRSNKMGRSETGATHFYKAVQLLFTLRQHLQKPLQRPLLRVLPGGI